MNVTYSKAFIKEVDKLPKDVKEEVANVIKIIKSIDDIKDIPNNKKLKGYKDVYRIRISSYRMIYLKETNTGIFIVYVAIRGQAYDKAHKLKIKGL